MEAVHLSVAKGVHTELMTHEDPPAECVSARSLLPFFENLTTFRLVTIPQVLCDRNTIAACSHSPLLPLQKRRIKLELLLKLLPPVLERLQRHHIRAKAGQEVERIATDPLSQNFRGRRTHLN